MICKLLAKIKEKNIRRKCCDILLLYFVVACLAGCAAFNGYPERPVELSQELMQLKESISSSKLSECIDKVNEEALACRNRLITARMYAIDIRFSEFEERLFRQTRESGFAATLSTLGLTSAAAVATGGTSQVFSGLAAFIIGGREAFQKEVLAERTVIAIHTAMRAGRAQVRLRLLNGLRQSIDDYPLSLALTNTNEYFDAGTVLGALVGISEIVGTQAKQAEEKIQMLNPLSNDTFTVEANLTRRLMLKTVDSLADDLVISIVMKPPVPMNNDMKLQADGIDRTGQRSKDPARARTILKAWISSIPSAGDYPKWAKAMKIQ